MYYGLGETLADYGFTMFEKLHSPMFLLNKNGTLKKVNEAGRKLLAISHLTAQQLDEFAKGLVRRKLSPQQVDYQKYPTGNKQIKVVSKQLGSSDYVLIELIR